MGARRAVPCGIANRRQVSNLAVMFALPEAPCLTSREVCRRPTDAVRTRRSVGSAIGFRYRSSRDRPMFANFRVETRLKQCRAFPTSCLLAAHVVHSAP
jgi:hypothetical protein